MKLQQSLHNGRLALLAAVIIIVIGLLPTASSLAQSGGSYEISAFIINAGIHESSGGSFIVTSVIDLSESETLSGGLYTIDGGYAGTGGGLSDRFTYLPVILRQ